VRAFVAPPEMAASESTACILVVDDDPDVITGLTGELEHRFGRDYQLLPAQGAQSGLGILERLGAASRPVALVVAGLGLPDMPGPEFLSRARSLHPLAKRIVLIDAMDFGRSDALHQAMTLGQADQWLMKPWAPRERLLYPRVGELLGEWAEDSERSQVAVAALHVAGERGARRSHELRDLLDRHNIPYNFHPVDTVDGSELLRRTDQGEDRLPVLVLYDGRVLVQPTNIEIFGALGIRTRPERGLCDVAVVGAGPAGLSAAVYAASEGLRTLLVEREAFGGQAGTSTRIRNYLGFSRGISGRHLAREACEQALLFGAEMVYGEVTGLRLEGPERLVLMKDGSTALTSTVVIATGVTYRHLEVPSVEQFAGAGVFYGAALTEAPALQGEDVVVVGGGNSAGQAVVHLSRFARRVTLVVRGESLAESMSAYLIDELRILENVTVRLRTQVVDAAGAGRLERLTLQAADSGAQHTVPAAALFVLIGAEPRTEWLAGVLERDADGYIRTGSEFARQGIAGPGSPPARAPLSFESSIPGVFAAGDVRAGSVKRVATAVGDGSIVIRMVHDYLSHR
jgi:thioredoxin reductase (NADPH)